MSIFKHPPLPSPCFVRLECPDLTDPRWKNAFFRASGWICFFCTWNNPDLRLLGLHVDIQHPLENQRFPRACVECDANFPNATYGMYHVQEHHRNISASTIRLFRHEQNEAPWDLPEQ